MIRHPLALFAAHRSALAASLAVLSAAVLTPHTAHASEDAARALAERFAGSSDTPAAPVAPPASAAFDREQREILERARREAAERKALEAQAAKRAETARAAAQKAADDKTAADLAAAQKREAEALQAEGAARETEAARLAEKLARVRAERPQTEPTPATPEPAAAASASPQPRERPDGAMGLGVPPMGLGVPPPAEPATAVSTETADNADGARNDYLPQLPAKAVRHATEVTVLLVMDPGTNGIRRGSKTADPVLCLENWCYVSNGPSAPARLMRRGAALGPVNTLSLRAGACRRQLTCIFRGLDIAAYFAAGARQPSLQPIDLRYLHHDRRAPALLKVDKKCAVRGKELVCLEAIKGKDWTAWIIPEDVAIEAGPDVLQAALASGLTAGRARTTAARAAR